MKPTLQIRIVPIAPIALQKEELAGATIQSNPEGMDELRQAVADALDKVTSNLNALRGEAPPVASPGTLSVQVVGIKEGKGGDAMAPLPGIRVQMQAGQDWREEIHTDASGLARLHLPATQQDGLEYEVSALDPQGGTIAKVRGKMQSDDAPTHRMEVVYSTALAPHFAHGRQWAKAVQRAVARLKKLAKAQMKVRPSVQRAQRHRT